ncbi:MAG: sigma-54 dependent transcriptional regulator [Candidatus Eisenbacteria bacterium]
MSTILCIDDEPTVSATLENALRGMGHRPVIAASIDEGIRAVGRETFDLIISDHQMPDGSGIDLLSALKRNGQDIPVIMTSSYHSVEQAVTSIRHGAVDYLTKPLRAEAVRIAVTNAIELDRMRRVNDDFQREISSLRGSRAIVGSSPALRSVMDVVRNVAPTRATVLLEGESGTGKELFARAVHELSPRAHQSFVTVNCAALPDGLVESTLFGHERGAFTGATARAQGAFERAHRGTLLLDEVSEMRLDLQAKLLRAIQEQEFERVGGNQPIKVDVRIVATTNRDLRSEVEAGRFRRDLYFRLHVVPIHTPSLRDRLEDIPELAEHFVTKIASQLGVRPPTITPDALDVLRRRRWTGNIREFGNAIERALILCRDGRITADAVALPEGEAHPASAMSSSAQPQYGQANGHLNGSSAANSGGVALMGPSLDEASFNLDVLERLAIQRALQATGGHRTKAARMLGISERTLRNKLKLV